MVRHVSPRFGRGSNIGTAVTPTATTGRDYSGVPTAQLAEVYHRYTTYSDIGLFAEKIGMEEGNLKKILLTQKYPFTGLHNADLILLGLGLNISQLARTGEITVVPAGEKWHSADRIVADLQWMRETSGSYATEEGEIVGSTPMDDNEVAAHIAKLKELRVTLCAPSDKQREILERDVARLKARQARNA